MRVLTQAEEDMIVALFMVGKDPQEGISRLTIRFDPKTPSSIWHVEKDSSRHKVRIHGATVLEYTTDSRRILRVRTADSRKWEGTVRGGGDIVVLRLIENGEKCDA
jgi:hypothetical protein